MRKSLFTLLLLLPALCTLTAATVRFKTDDGLCFNTSDKKTATLIERWYSPKYEFTELVIPDSVAYNGKMLAVTRIGKSAFRNTPLQNVVIPETIEYIEGSAFQGTPLTSIVFPKSVINLGDLAFCSCKSLTTITIPGNIISIGNGCFEGCTNLTEVNLSEGLKTIEVSAFNGCKGLTSIVIPESVENLGGFNDCTNLTTINIPKNLKRILGDAFYYTSIAKIELPETVIEIGKRAFYNCSNLTEVKLSNNIKRLENETFRDCINLRTISIPDSLKYIGDAAFYGCKGLNIDIVFPNGFNEIGYSAFNGSAIKSVYLPESFTDFGSSHSVFYKCTNLESINLSNVKSIKGNLVFYECASLKEVNLSSAEHLSGETIFCGCDAIESVTLGKSLKIIGPNVFAGCKAISKVEITDLNNWFNVIMSNDASNPINYSHKIFVKGREITSLTIPDGMERIGNYQFQGWTRFKKVIIPSTVTKIGEGAFQNCQNLKTVEFSGTNCVDSIGDWAFQGTALGAYDFSDKLYFLGASFKGCASLQSVSLPEGLSFIGNSAFMDCTTLTKVSIPSTVEAIGNDAFKNCSSLDSIYIPSSVKYLGNEAFYGCSNIKGVYIDDVVAWCKMKIANFTNLQMGGAMSMIGIDTKSNPLIYAGNLYLNGELITDLVVPGSVDYVSDFAFQGAKCLTSVTISEGVDTLGGKSFADCINIKTIRLPKSLKAVPSTSGYGGGCAFHGIHNGSNTVDIYIEDLENWIKYELAKSTSGMWTTTDPFVNLYLNNELLVDAVVPESIENMTRYAFYRVKSIKSVTLPSGLMTLYEEYFIGNKSIKTLYMRGEFPPSFQIALSSSSSLAFDKIYVPAGCGEDYKDSWSKFASIIIEAPEETEFSGNQTAETLKENKVAHGSVYNKSVTSVVLTNATLADDVTAETLKNGDNNPNTLYYMPEGTDITGDNIIIGGQAESIVLTDKQAFGCTTAFTAAKVNYDRIYNNEKATMYLPYALNENQLDGLTVLKCKGLSSDGNTVEFEKVTSTEANTPYLVYANGNDVQMGEIENIKIETTPNIPWTDELQFIGTYEKKVLTSSEYETYYIFYGDKFYNVGKNVTVNPFRAYITLPVGSSAKSHLPMVIIDGQTTDITELSATNNMSFEIYSVDGRLVRKNCSPVNATKGLSCGLYIVNGKKVVIK